MATREMALCFALSALTATATAQTAPEPENWTPDQSYGSNDHRPCDIHAGRNHVPERKIAHAGPRWPDVVQARDEEEEGDGRSLQGHIAGRPSLEDGNKLCKGKPVAYLIVWKSDSAGNEANPRSLAPFSGQKFNAGLPDDCGRFTYGAGAHLTQCADGGISPRLPVVICRRIVILIRFHRPHDMTLPSGTEVPHAF